MRPLLVLFVLAAASCTPEHHVECKGSESCDLGGGGQGTCKLAPSGHRWCAYSDATCEGSSLRYSTYDVGDDLAGTCVDPGPHVVSQTPTGNGVELSPSIVVTFSEPID